MNGAAVPAPEDESKGEGPEQTAEGMVLGASPVSEAAEARHPMQLLNHSRCTPCSFHFFKEDGCRWGDNCFYCHWCTEAECRVNLRRTRRVARKKKAIQGEHEIYLKQGCRHVTASKSSNAPAAPSDRPFCDLLGASLDEAMNRSVVGLASQAAGVR